MLGGRLLVLSTDHCDCSNLAIEIVVVDVILYVEVLYYLAVYYQQLQLL